MSAAATHVAHHFDDAEQQYTAASLGMWLFLATEVLFFGGMFSAVCAISLLVSRGVCRRQPSLESLAWDYGTP